MPSLSPFSRHHDRVGRRNPVPSPFRRPLLIEPLENRRLLVCVVTSTQDPSEEGETTLRDCIESGDGEIEFSLGEGKQTIHVEDGPIVVDEQIVIRGMLNRPTEIDLRQRVEISGTTADGSESSRIFEVRPAGDLTINDLTLRDGNASSTVSPGQGGAIFNDGFLTINNSTLHSNSAFNGGAVFSRNANVSIFQSTLSGNSAILFGGAITIVPSAVPSRFGIRRSTFTDNVSLEFGGALYLGSNVIAEIRNSIISGNTATFGSDVVNSSAAEVEFSLLGSTEGFEYVSQYGPPIIAPPGLAPLRDNGGETETHMVMINSRAIDSADQLIATGEDQRGAPRAVCVTRVCEGGGADIGAVERGTSFPSEPDCDFNNDGACDCDDIDLLVDKIVGGSMNLAFDLNVDALVDTLDIEIWLQLAGQMNVGHSYLPGDADLDGNVDGVDYLVWNAHKFSTAATGWCQGDFDANGLIDGADFLVWNQFKFLVTPSVTVLTPGPKSVRRLVLRPDSGDRQSPPVADALALPATKREGTRALFRKLSNEAEGTDNVDAWFAGHAIWL